MAIDALVRELAAPWVDGKAMDADAVRGALRRAVDATRDAIAEEIAEHAVVDRSGDRWVLVDDAIRAARYGSATVRYPTPEFEEA